MNVVGKVSSFISQGMYSVATPFHPFGGAVDIIVVKQQDGTFRSTPWYVRFGKFQGVFKGAEKIVRIEINGVEADFNMFLDNSGEAYFVREINPGKEDNEGLKETGNSEGRMGSNSTDYENNFNGYERNDLYGQEVNGNSNDEVEVQDAGFDFGINNLKRVDSDSGHMFYEFQDDQSSIEGSLELSEYGSTRYDTFDSVEHTLESQNSDSEVVLVSVDGHILTAPISSSEREGENVQLSTPQFHLGPSGRTEEYNTDKDAWTSDYFSDLDASAHTVSNENVFEANGGLLSSDNHLEPCEEHRKLSSYAQKSQKIINYVKDSSIESLSPSTPDVSERDEIFQSCLELSELALQSTNGHPETSGPSFEVHETSEDTNNRLDQSTSKNHETENGNNEILNFKDGSRPHVSGSRIVEAATHERNTLNMANDRFDEMPIQSDCIDQEKTERNALGMAHNGFDKVPVQFDHKTDEDSMVESKQIVADFPAFNDRGEDGEGQHTEPCTGAPSEDLKSHSSTRPEISLCGNMLHPGMGLCAAEEAFDANRISLDEFKHSASSVVMNKCLIVRLQGKYLPWDKAAHIILGMAAFGLDLPVEPDYVIPVEQVTPEVKEDTSGMSSTSSRRWRLWPIPFRRVKTLKHTISNQSNEDEFVESGSVSWSEPAVTTPTSSVVNESPHKQMIRTNVPTSDQIASLNLKEGQNMVNFVFCTRVLGSQKVEAHIYLWKWNTRIVVSDVDGTITKSDVLGQFMPLVGKDWTHSGIARLFSAIKENGYQLLFLSARAIVQAYLTKSFLFNLKQDGKSLPNGPVVISPDGLFPSLYREVIRRAPHEFKIACLEDIKALFPSDYNPFYAGFGNRSTDELSYRKVGIPKGKIFIINPKGEVAINHCVDVKSYTSFHTLVHDMFPPTALIEQEDYNSWNYWKMPLPDIEEL